MAVEEQVHSVVDALDGCPFSSQDGAVIERLIECFDVESNTLFSSLRRGEREPIASYNPRTRRWEAGRYVGLADFDCQGKRYRATISPRFGESHLLGMLETIYNVRLSTANAGSGQTGLDFLIKKIISYIWLNKLARANQHGLPKVNRYQRFTGSMVRGKLRVRESLLPFRASRTIVSEKRTKHLHGAVFAIIAQAFTVLKRHYFIGQLDFPSGARDIINHLGQLAASGRPVGLNEYHAIRYSDIYRSYKDAVDFSWEILNRRAATSQRKDMKNGYCFFIDIAEIWEQYVRTLLARHFRTRGWAVSAPEETTYGTKAFRWRLLPDIVMRRGNNVAVWDAKYKRMTYSSLDYDRPDLYQIHGYMSYYGTSSNVVAGGLLYPLSAPMSKEAILLNTSKGLFNEGTGPTFFRVDGIEVAAIRQSSDPRDDIASMRSEEHRFLDRMEALLS